MCEDNQPDYRDDDHNHHRNEYSDSVSIVEVSDNKNDTVVEFPILFDDYDVIERHENISYIDNGEVINDDNNTAKNQSMNIINRKSYDGDGDYLEMFSIPNCVYSRKSNTVDDDDDDDADHKITIINEKIKNQHKKKTKKVKAYRNNNNHNNDANNKSDDINVDVETKLFNDLNLYLHDQQQSMIIGNKYGLSYDELLMKTSQNMYFQNNDDYDDDVKANHHSHRLQNYHFSDDDDNNHEKRIHKSVQFSTNIISDKKNAKHKMKYNHQYHNHGDDSDSSGIKSTKIKVNFNSGTITHNIIVITITIIVIIVVVVIIIITIFITLLHH